MISGRLSEIHQAADAGLEHQRGRPDRLRPGEARIDLQQHGPDGERRREDADRQIDAEAVPRGLRAPIGKSDGLPA